MELAFGGRQIDALRTSYRVDVEQQTGAGTLRVPVPAPPGRNGLAPALALVYSSGAGNSAFGAGWSLDGLPAITLDTRFHLPRWDGTDGYQLGGDELVPWLDPNSPPAPRGYVSGDWSVAFFRSRRGSGKTRTEKWVHVPTGRVHFRTRDERNVVTVYGARANAAARIADPADEARTFAWLPELRIDPTGNALWFEYAAETLDGVPRKVSFERTSPSLAQRYLKRIAYGNRSPLAVDDVLALVAPPDGIGFCYQLVLDYGDHIDPKTPSATPDRAWLPREDPFSSYRNGFEVRTYRLCRRFLAFHDFTELGPTPTLVAALALTHAEDPAGATLTKITQTGYRSDNGAVSSRSIPPLRMSYAPPATASTFIEVSARAQENVPAGLLGRRLTFVDLLGEGLEGILTESDRSWLYKPNLGGGEFGAQAMVLERPATRPGAFGFGDVDRDGNTDLSQLGGRLAGFYALDRDDQVWRPFRPFDQFPHVEALGGRAQWVDLNGDGRPDILVAKEDAFVWFASEGDAFAAPIEVPRPPGADAPPATTADPSLDFFFADMTGDGLPDLVRVQNGRVEYWPSLGNGHFGGAVVMDGAPQFASDDGFDASRLRFVDLDGSGTADIVYLRRGEVSCWINAAGNQFAAGPRLTSLPYLDNVSSVRVLDFLGDGSSCLVWSSPLPGRESPLEYLPLTPALRPRLLTSVDDSIGRRTTFTYSSSATHYLRDMASGRGWSTKLPTHHPVVDRHEVLDQIGNTRLVQRFEYHDGYYDGEEREQRGFGQVDVYDAEAVDGTSPGPTAAAFAAPSLVRTWFHLGTAMWGHCRPMGTYARDPSLPWLQAHVIDGAEGMTAPQIEEGLRALAGRIIRREVYAVGARDVAARDPFEVFQASFRLVCHQPAHSGAKAAFSVVPLEDATWVYEQVGSDPRVTHNLVLETDAYDAPVVSATIGYARRSGQVPDVPTQALTAVRVEDRRLLNIDTQDRYELGIPFDTKSFELVGVVPSSNGLFTRDLLRSPSVTASLAAPNPHNVKPDPSLGPAARQFSWTQSFYWNDTLAGVLPLGQAGVITLLHHQEAACFAHTFVANALAGRIADPQLSAQLTSLHYATRAALWWQVGATQQPASAAQFFQPLSNVRADGATSSVAYDSYALAIVSARDALGNTSAAHIDYHQLAPSRIIDPNGNAREVRYDPLGVVVSATTHGTVGTQPWGFDGLSAVTALTPPTLADALANPSKYLQGAASFTFYDLNAWSADGVPTTVLSLEAEQLRNDGAGGGTNAGRIQVGVAYFDGFGRTLQTKTLVEDGPAIERDAQQKVIVDVGGNPVLAAASPRWRASGHVVYDTKGHPGRQYDPFFSPSANYEGDPVLETFGVSTVTHYDALGRPVGQDLPNGTFTSTTFSAWRLERADANDNVVGSLYAAVRASLPSGSPELQAYQEAVPHAGTTLLSYLDPLGRQVGNLAQGGAGAADRRTTTELDIAGAVLRVTDPRNLTALAYERDMQGRALFQESIDAGKVATLLDAFDRVVTIWDVRGFQIDRGYDLADRPTHTDVTGGDGSQPFNNRVEQWTYGESLGTAPAASRNLLGRVLAVSDCAGQVTVDRYDPTGQPMSSTRSLRSVIDNRPDWRAVVPLEAETYTTTAVYDALGRPTTDTLPDGTIRGFVYLASGPLTEVRLTTPDGSLTSTPVLNGTAYGARGERQSVQLGNGVQVAYGYDNLTNRLATQAAKLGTKQLQGIQYTYDPVGNLVRLVDTAQQAPSPLISGVMAPARRDYAYDAHYRLQTATGRVHQALLQNDYVPATSGTFMGTRRLSLNDGTAIETFKQSYAYDASGNLLSLKHVGQSQSWTTAMWVSPTSNRSALAVDPTTRIAVSTPESNFDPGGNLVQVAHLREMGWTFRGELDHAVVIRRTEGADDAESYVYCASGMRVRKVTTQLVASGQVQVTEKVYFGDSERKRVTIGGTLILERWTTHVSDGEQRIALIHRWVADRLAREVDSIKNPHVRYQFNTHQGSSALELDAAGGVISYEEYFPYGGTAFIAGENLRDLGLKEYRYSGKECDGFTGLYYYGYRYYAPWMGRWLSPDPIGAADDLNLYRFVLSNPTTFVDRDGLDTSSDPNKDWARIALPPQETPAASPSASIGERPVNIDRPIPYSPYNFHFHSPFLSAPYRVKTEHANATVSPAQPGLSVTPGSQGPTAAATAPTSDATTSLPPLPAASAAPITPAPIAESQKPTSPSPSAISADQAHGTDAGSGWTWGQIAAVAAIVTVTIAVGVVTFGIGGVVVAGVAAGTMSAGEAAAITVWAAYAGGYAQGFVNDAATQELQNPNHPIDYEQSRIHAGAAAGASVLTAGIPGSGATGPLLSRLLNTAINGSLHGVTFETSREALSGEELNLSQILESGLWGAAASSALHVGPPLAASLVSKPNPAQVPQVEVQQPRFNVQVRDDAPIVVLDGASFGYLDPDAEPAWFNVQVRDGAPVVLPAGASSFTYPQFDELQGRHGDFHGPWRPLPEPDPKWGDFLRRMTGTEPPVGMRRPHAHHGVFKEGLPGRQRELVDEAHDLLKRRAGIDPIWDVRNLGWAPNKGHTTAVMEDLVTRLRALDAANGTPNQFESLLRQFLEEAAAR